MHYKIGKLYVANCEVPHYLGPDDLRLFLLIKRAVCDSDTWGVDRGRECKKCQGLLVFAGEEHAKCAYNRKRISYYKEVTG